MALLEMLAMVSALAALVVCLHPVSGKTLLLPIAMLGATSGIALGLLGAGQLWMSGGIALLVVGPVELVNQQAFEALFADGRRAERIAIHPVVCTTATAVATVLFALA